jgi:hypothetical protein
MSAEAKLAAEFAQALIVSNPVDPSNHLSLSEFREPQATEIPQAASRKRPKFRKPKRESQA